MRRVLLTAGDTQINSSSDRTIVRYYYYDTSFPLQAGWIQQFYSYVSLLRTFSLRQFQSKYCLIRARIFFSVRRIQTIDRGILILPIHQSSDSLLKRWSFQLVCFLCYWPSPVPVSMRLQPLVYPLQLVRSVKGTRKWCWPAVRLFQLQCLPNL